MNYKVSYVVVGSQHPGAIMSHKRRPKVGDHVQIDDRTFEIVEVTEMMAARNDLHFLHETRVCCAPCSSRRNVNI